MSGLEEHITSTGTTVGLRPIAVGQTARQKKHDSVTAKSDLNVVVDLIQLKDRAKPVKLLVQRDNAATPTRTYTNNYTDTANVAPRGLTLEEGAPPRRSNLERVSINSPGLKTRRGRIS